MTEKQEAIEITPPVHKYWYETPGGPVTTFRLRLMTREQIESHELQKYAPKEGERNAE